MGFIFEVSSATESIEQRTDRLRQRISRKVKSGLKDKTSTPKVFRVKQINNILSQCYKDVGNFTRSKVGHRPGSKAIFSYTNHPTIVKIKDRLANIVCNEAWVPENSTECGYLRDGKSCLQPTQGNKPVCQECDGKIEDIAWKTFDTYFPQRTSKDLEDYNDFFINTSQFCFTATGPDEIELYKVSLLKAMIIRKMAHSEKNIVNAEAHGKMIRNNVTCLSPDDQKVFEKFKKFTELGIYPPVYVSWDEDQNFVVRCSQPILKNSLICEYTGHIIEEKDLARLNIKDDSLMQISPGVLISPVNVGNIGKFISGINNNLRKVGNLKSMCFKLNRKCHIIIYACEGIDKDEILAYDYNAGRGSNYPTEYFKDIGGNKMK
jgi:hypothetical protein